MIAGRETPAGSGSAAPPSLRRRLACLLYEGVLLFGVLMIAGIVYSILTQQRHALEGKFGLQAFVFLVLGIYFTWFWSHGGQTLAMRAWNLRVVRLDGAALTQARALARYLLSWMWFMPALVVCAVAGLKTTTGILGALAAGIVAYAGLARLRRDGRLWHDVVCDTCVITWQPRPRTA